MSPVHSAGSSCLEQGDRLRDLVGVPARPVLVGQEDERAVDEPGVAAGVLEQGQREQGPEHGRVHDLARHPHEPDRRARDVGAEQVRPRAGCVPRGEREVRDLRDDVEPPGQVARLGHRERDAGADDLLLRAGDARGHRRLGDEEEPGDLPRLDADDEAQAQGRGGVRRERGVRAHEDEAEAFVLDDASRVGTHGLHLLTSVGVDEQQRLLALRHRLGPEPVDDPPTRGREQPGGRVVGDAVVGPPAGGRLEGVGQGVLDEVEATELGEQEGDEPAPLTTHRLGERGVGTRHGGSQPSMCIAGRISRVYAGGSSRATAIAASRSGRSTR